MFATNMDTASSFTFDEKTHSYFLDGKPMTGVTTVLGMVAKPALLPWAVKCAIEHIQSNAKDITTNHDHDEPIYQVPLALLEEAKKAHTRKKDDAANKGTDVHGILEEIIKGAIEYTDGYILAENLGGHPENDQVRHFVEWAMNNKVKFTASEKRVFSRTHFYAGTLDFLCEIDGKTYVGDIKTSNGVYGRSYFAQCAAYRLALEEMWAEEKEYKYTLRVQDVQPGEYQKLHEEIEKEYPTFEGSLIVRIGKDGKFNEEKDVLFSPYYEDDRKFFLSALELYRQENNMFEATYYKPRK